jgi:hypothetical protein
MDLHTIWQGVLLIKENTVEIVEGFFLNWGNLSLLIAFMLF